MNSELKPWQHAGLSLLILAMVVYIFYLLIIQPAVSARIGFHDRVEFLSFQHEKLVQLIGQRDQLLDDANRLQAYQFDQASFLEQKAAPLAAADLQQIANTLITAGGGNVVSTQVVQSRDDDVFQQVTVNVTMRGDIEALQRILFDISQHQPVLFVDNVLVQRQGGRGRGAPRPAGIRSRRSAPATVVESQPGPEQLQVRFDISAYIFKDAISS